MKKSPEACCALQVHGIGGALGVWWYALAAKQDFVYELYGRFPTKALSTCSAPSTCTVTLHTRHSCEGKIQLLQNNVHLLR